MKTILIAIFSLFSFAASANYVKGAIGYNLSGEAELEGPGGSIEEDLDSKFLSPILVAYGFELLGDVHGEVEFAYRQDETDGNPSTDINTMTGAFNVVGNAPMGAITLTGGAGATFGQYDFDVTGLDSGTAFGLQIFGGVDFKVQENFTLGGELRYNTTVTDIDCGSDIDGKLNSMSLLFAAKFMM